METKQNSRKYYLVPFIIIYRSYIENVRALVCEVKHNEVYRETKDIKGGLNIFHITVLNEVPKTSIHCTACLTPSILSCWSPPITIMKMLLMNRMVLPWCGTSSLRRPLQSTSSTVRYLVFILIKSQIHF